MLVAAPLLAGLAASCDAPGRARDSAPPPGEHMSAVSLRLDMPLGGTITASLLAFNATVTGMPAGDVLGVVDPLSAQPPASGCELRDVGTAARSGKVELTEASGLEIEAAGTVLRPTATLFPDLGLGARGVVAEATPVPLPGRPDSVDVSTTLPPLVHATLSLDAPPPALVAPALPQGAPLALARDLDLTVTPGAAVELRPFGATSAIACAPAADGRVTLPAALVVRLGRPPFTASLDVVTRTTMPGLGAMPAISVEQRASRLVEVRP